MHTVTRFAALVGFAIFLCACGGSGSGGSDLAGEETSCGQPECGPDTDPPPAASPTPGGQSDPSAPLVCGGTDGATCPSGYHCVNDPTAACDAATGMDCAGICVLGDALPDCGLVGEACPDGYACIDDPADDCEGGPPVDCPGVCRPMAQSECVDDTSCPVIDARCTTCADGSQSCPQVRCVNGACMVDVKPCSTEQRCGGLADESCQPGFLCVDDPADECIPDRGDSDCGGICVPDTIPRACAYTTCPAGFECVDDATDMCPPENGADCPAICQPSSGGECTSDAECRSMDAPCSVCADGTELCPRAICDQGKCRFDFPTCPAPPGCATDADCAPGQICALPPDGMCDPATGMPNCAGVCVPDSGPRPCGGASGDTCPEGYVCTGDRGADCEPDAAGNGCSGICVPAPPPACHTADDCINPQDCTRCTDDSLSCPQAECVNGMCTVKPPLCPGPTECSADADCAIPEICSMCPNGAFSCPQAQCQNGVCIALYPGCPDAETCGGIAGVPCPPGFTCVDRPGDDCDPNQGGADCEGVCRREEEPRKCAGFTGETCPPGYECIDAMDDCVPDQGGADCPGFCRPAPARSCASDAECPVIAAPCQICADGSTACPRSSCENGQCRFEFPTCEPGMGPTAE